MAVWTKFRILNAMTAGLAVIGFVGALTIDNQLAVIKNDCFERLAIGNRLNEKDVYAQFEYKTVAECQRECTEEGDKCRSFSFGIGVKGNGSCELSTKVVKETVDLKPIGTVQDPEYDLYIKKLGCKIVIEQKPTTEGHIDADALNHQDERDKVPDSYGSSSSSNYKPSDGYGTSGGNYKPGDGYGSNYKPNDGYGNSNAKPSDGYGSSGGNYKPNDSYGSSGGNYKPSDSYGSSSSNYKPSDGYGGNDYKRRPDYVSGLQQVHTTLISIRPDPNRPAYTGLGPGIGYHDPSEKNRPDRYGDVRKPPYMVGYEFDGRPVRPYRPYEEDPYRYGRPGGYGYGDARPPFRPSSLNHPYDDGEKGFFRPAAGEYDPGPSRPITNHIGFTDDKGYGGVDRLDFDVNSLPPRRNDRPKGDADYERPFVNRFSGGYDTRPAKPYDGRPSDGYDSGPKPVFEERPRPGYERPKPFDNNRPEYERPLNGYDDRPPLNGYNDGYGGDRPDPPPPLNRPRPINDGYGGDRPDPRPPLNRPRPINDGYSGGRPEPPPLNRPRPINDGYGGDRPDPPPPLNRPRPINDGYGGDRPDPPPPLNRPRPINDGYAGDRPDPPPPLNRPRPINDGYGGDRPDPPPPLNRPRPINDGYQSERDRRPPGYSDDRSPRPPGYDDRSPRPPGYDDDRPPPFPPLSRPRPLSDGYGPDSDRPPPNRPRPVDSGYDGPIKDDRRPPLRPIDDRPGLSRPEEGYGSSRPFRPSDDGYDRPRPNDDYDRPRPGEPYNGPRPSGYDRPRPEQPYDGPRPERPIPLFDRPGDGHNRDPNDPNSGYANGVRPLNDSYGGNRRQDRPEAGRNASGADANKIQNTQRPENPHEKPKPIVTHSIGPHGELITAIITELDPGKT